MVPCNKSYSTCQGSKVCPYVDKIQVRKPHYQVNASSWEAYSSCERGIAVSHPERDVLEATIGLWATYRDKGCFGPLVEVTQYSPLEQTRRNKILSTPEKAKRGHTSKRTCDGRLVLKALDPDLLVQCEHYHPLRSKTHTSHLISASKYDTTYFQALFHNIPGVIATFEERMLEEGYGPLAVCDTIKNFTSMSIKCSNHHRDTDGHILMTEVVHLPCESLLYLKQTEDQTLPPHERYIRYAEEVPLSDEEPGTADPFRLAVCILAENSKRLVQDARHVQSDISFKRVSGWLEFELGGFDRTTNGSVCYCRVYLNRQTAEAHRLLLLKIHEIVRDDTGCELQFRHLHATRVDDVNFRGILSWTVDQHGGQAKGIGEYLQEISPAKRRDLHEPHRYLKDLGPYDHLARILRICLAHFYRNIQETHCDSKMQDVMRSFACFRHSDWDGAVQYITEHGNKRSKDWFADKERSKFAFPALCWEKSKIPERIWQAVDGTSNIIESLHQDSLIEGDHCTLVGGVLKAAAYDRFQLQSHTTTQLTGINKRYRVRDSNVRQQDTLRRKANARNKLLAAQDKLINDQNTALQKARNDLQSATQRVLNHNQSPHEHAEKLQKAHRAEQKAKEKYEKTLETSRTMADGEVGS
ncbi:hypothetical protein PQX77_000554, partial [Marasmius sp. AFHP31]